MGQYSIGQPVSRLEDPRLLRGEGRFLQDMALPREAHAAIVRSPHAHARVVAVDAAAARAMPGVLAVLTGAEYAADGLGIIPCDMAQTRRDGSQMYRPPRPAIALDRVAHVGAPVAMVVAETLDRAKDAAERVAVEYEPLPAVIDTATALDAATPVIWADCGSNEGLYWRRGNAAAVDRAFAEAAHVVRRRLVINRITALPMEPRGAIGAYDPGTGRYTLYAGHQRPFLFRRNITQHILKIPENQLRIVTGDIGGSFGLRGSIFPELGLVLWAAKRVGRPVKWICERTEGFLSDDHARDNVTDAALALDKDGRFLAFRTRTNANLGAYVSFRGAGPAVGNVGSIAGVYTTPAIDAEVSGIFSNTHPTAPYRGAGRPEAAYVIERMVDLAAAELGLDPAELRRRNTIPASAMPYKTALTYTYDSGDFGANLEKALEIADYAGFEARRRDAASRGRLRGIGISNTIENAAGASLETAELRFDPSGGVTLVCGSIHHGQGHATVQTQILFDRLGIAPASVNVIQGDTDAVTFGTGTGGSRSATLSGSATVRVCEKIEAKAKKIAAHLLEAAEADVTFAEGTFTVAGTDRSVTLSDVAKAAFNPAKLPADVEPGLYDIATYNAPVGNFPNGCHVVEVEIDPETGATRLERYTVVDDCGTVLNPLLLEGQIMGGIAQGMGQALMEDIAFDRATGQLLSGSFMDYAMPRADDFCEVDLHSNPVPTPSNPLGVKGAGEAGTVGALSAVCNAVINALSPLGVCHLDMPATPEKVWRAIRDARAA
ncbi:MAG: xanthine dehydrogenase family protein molybdopterin-binding subunit [Rhodospirillales bacterium]